MGEDRRERTVRLLGQARADERAPLEELLALVYDEMRVVAAAYLRRERPAHTLQPTALVNEACLRLLDDPKVEAGDRRRFLALAARAMRQVLVDHARRHGAEKRGGGRERVTWVDPAVIGGQSLDLLALDEALTALAGLDPRKARVVELRYFAGMTSREAGEVLGVSETTAEDDWYMARAWLRDRLAG